MINSSIMFDVSTGSNIGKPCGLFFKFTILCLENFNASIFFLHALKMESPSEINVRTFMLRFFKFARKIFL